MIVGAVFWGMDAQTWTGIAIGSAVTIVVAFLIYRLQRAPKTLDYAAYDPQRLGVEDDIYPGLSLTVECEVLPEGQYAPEGPYAPEGHYATEARLVQALTQAQVSAFRFQNTGKRAIRAVDFQQPITISTTQGRLLHGIVGDSSRKGVCGPENCRLVEDTANGQVVEVGGEDDHGEVFEVTPALLNPGDWFEVAVLTDGNRNGLDVSAWVVEESRSMRKRQRLMNPPFRKVFLEGVMEGVRNFDPFGVPLILWLVAVVAVLAALGAVSRLFAGA